jgi:hypothetical protein
MRAVPLLATGPNPAASLAELRQAALADDTGAALRDALGRLSIPAAPHPSTKAPAKVEKAA